MDGSVSVESENQYMENSFIDIEQGSIALKNNSEEEISMSEVYASENHFIDKLAIELENIKTKHTESGKDKYSKIQTDQFFTIMHLSGGH